MVEVIVHSRVRLKGTINNRSMFSQGLLAAVEGCDSHVEIWRRTDSHEVPISLVVNPLERHPRVDVNLALRVDNTVVCAKGEELG